MGKVYEGLDEKLIAFIRRQKLFFVATAPLSAEGCVNVSPKGMTASRSSIPEHWPTWISAALGLKPMPIFSITGELP